MVTAAIVTLVALLASTTQATSTEEPKIVLPPSNEGVNIVNAKVGDRELHINLILPKEKSDKPLPVIVWIHGGGWKAGDYTRNRAAEFTKHGYAAASVEYRFTDVAPLPAQVYDCKAAIRFLRANAKKYNLDPNHFGVWGASAGGHLAALIGTSAGIKELEGDLGNHDQSTRVQAVCSWCGLYDMNTGFLKRPKPGKPEPIIEYLGGTYSKTIDLVKLVSPVTHITKDDPPFLIVHGDQDYTIPIKQADLFDEALRKTGIETTLVKIKGGNHIFTSENTEPSMDELVKIMLEFFDKHLKPKPSH